MSIGQVAQLTGLPVYGARPWSGRLGVE